MLPEAHDRRALGATGAWLHNELLGGRLDVSVVIPTRDRVDLLGRCLDALCRQQLPNARFEVIVVDDSPARSSREIVTGVSGRTGHGEATPTVRYLESGGRGPAAARNRGWEEATAPVIAFTDDDCLPDPHWLEAGLAVMQDGSTVGAWGRIVVPIPQRPTDYEANTANLERAVFGTANCFYRRKTLEVLGGFDERFKIAWREDSDLYFRLLEAGLRTKHAPDAVVRHPVRAARWGVSLAEQRKSYWNALLYKKHRVLYRERLQPSPPYHYYAIVLSALVTVGLSWLPSPVDHDERKPAVRRTWTHRVALLTWLALTSRFASRRLRHRSRRPGHVVEMALTSVLIPFLSVYWRLRGAIRFRVLFM